MVNRIILLLLFLSGINAQIALPTFQGVHKPHASPYESGSQTFSYTGAEQTLTIPSGVESITIVAYGAQGGFDGGAAGGLGGYSTGTVSVTAGNTIYIYVGEQGTSGDGGIACNLAGGWNGGGDTGNCCGGSNPAGGGAGAVQLSTGQAGRPALESAGGGGDPFRTQPPGCPRISGGVPERQAPDCCPPGPRGCGGTQPGRCRGVRVGGPGG